ncbi:Hsp20/alpha crystallin family protein [Mucilaginibacter sp. Bleaf8]|uniref:Hsp20/alpha crystallin family protein n=1 Tax=Mucilaginibacter sp. Bleaf8 TaxID=2834430 RepID=UPI001BCCAB27|nr:Hsp20/alpha crystallin family protein [Mucilaginibacter sp. Bleaf8]MBS7565020.1 Hsp20/alpha crystallin family protein [Mucilaginibacter sp. Bleaf8]
MSLVKWNNEKKNHGLMPEFTDIFESFFNDSFMADRLITRVPAVNISETPEEYHVELAAPGLNKQDFKISTERNMLTVAVEQRSENAESSKKYNKREFSYSSFVRSFTLPESADDSRIEATYTDGVLQLSIPKKEEAKSISRQIEIK